MTDTRIKVDSYGELLAAVNNMELVSFEEDGSYQGDYLAVLKDGKRLFYYMDSYGSCSGCDWLEDNNDYGTGVEYTKALEYCGGIKPLYIVPADSPLTFINKGAYNGWELATPNSRSTKGGEQ